MDLAKRQRPSTGGARKGEGGRVTGGPSQSGAAERRPARHLEARLTVLPKNYVRLRIGGDLIIKNLKTDAVVDIIRGVGE